MRAVGVVLAGGRSSRFGVNKAEADFGGAPLVLRSVSALRTDLDIVALNGPSELAKRLGLPCVQDLDGASRGPLAGVAAALIWARDLGCDAVVTAPCDTPFLPEAFAAALLRGLADGPVAAAFSGRSHPLCAAWRVSLADAVRGLALQHDQPPLERLVSDLGGGFVVFDDDGAFANVNTPEDFSAAIGRLGRVT